MSYELCLPFEVEYTTPATVKVDADSCVADILPVEVKTEAVQPQQPIALVEPTYQPTKKVYGLTHQLPQQDPTLDDLLTSVL